MQTKNIYFLQQSLFHHRAAHACLFYGPDISTLSEAGKWFAKALNCLSFEKMKEPCQKCISCQKIEKGLHPDVMTWTPQGALRSIRIDQIRELQNQASFKSFEGKSKVHILQEADCLHITAANALLKVLEEPPPQTFIVLTTTHPESLLPTILSRCQLFPFRSESENFSFEMFPECEGNSAFLNILKELAGGSLARAKHLVESGVWEKKKVLLKSFEQGLSGSFISVFGQAERIVREVENEIGILEDKIDSEEKQEDPSARKKAEEEKKVFLSSERSRILREFLRLVLTWLWTFSEKEFIPRFPQWMEAVEDAKRFLDRGAQLKWVMEVLLMKIRPDFEKSSHSRVL